MTNNVQLANRAEYTQAQSSQVSDATEIAIRIDSASAIQQIEASSASIRPRTTGSGKVRAMSAPTSTMHMAHKSKSRQRLALLTCGIVACGGAGLAGVGYSAGLALRKISEHLHPDVTTAHSAQYLSKQLAMQCKLEPPRVMTQYAFISQDLETRNKKSIPPQLPLQLTIDPALNSELATVTPAELCQRLQPEDLQQFTQSVEDAQVDRNYYERQTSHLSTQLNSKPLHRAHRQLLLDNMQFASQLCQTGRPIAGGTNKGADGDVRNTVIHNRVRLLTALDLKARIDRAIVALTEEARIEDSEAIQFDAAFYFISQQNQGERKLSPSNLITRHLEISNDLDKAESDGETIQANHLALRLLDDIAMVPSIHSTDAMDLNTKDANFFTLARAVDRHLELGFSPNTEQDDTHVSLDSKILQRLLVEQALDMSIYSNLNTLSCNTEKLMPIQTLTEAPLNHSTPTAQELAAYTVVSSLQAATAGLPQLAEAILTEQIDWALIAQNALTPIGQAGLLSDQGLLGVFYASDETVAHNTANTTHSNEMSVLPQAVAARLQPQLLPTANNTRDAQLKLKSAMHRLVPLVIFEQLNAIGVNILESAPPKIVNGLRKDCLALVDVYKNAGPTKRLRQLEQLATKLLASENGSVFKALIPLQLSQLRAVGDLMQLTLATGASITISGSNHNNELIAQSLQKLYEGSHTFRQAWLEISAVQPELANYTLTTEHKPDDRFAAFAPQAVGQAAITYLSDSKNPLTVLKTLAHELTHNLEPGAVFFGAKSYIIPGLNKNEDSPAHNRVAARFNLKMLRELGLAADYDQGDYSNDLTRCQAVERFQAELTAVASALDRNEPRQARAIYYSIPANEKATLFDYEPNLVGQSKVVVAARELFLQHLLLSSDQVPNFQTDSKQQALRSNFMSKLQSLFTDLSARSKLDAIWVHNAQVMTGISTVEPNISKGELL